MNRFVAILSLIASVSASSLHHGAVLSAPHYGGHLAALPSQYAPALAHHGASLVHGAHLAAPAIAHSAAYQTGDYAKVATVSGIAPGIPVAATIRAAPLYATGHHGHHAAQLAYGHHGLASPLTHGHLAAPLAHAGHLAAPLAHGHGHLARTVVSPYASPYNAFNAPLLAGHGLTHGAVLGHHAGLAHPQVYGHHGLASPLIAGHHGYASPLISGHGAHLIKK